MNKIKQIREYISDNALPLYYAFAAGSIVTSTTLIILNKDKTLLKVSVEQLAMLKKGGAVVYELKDQTLHLVNIPAVEATLS